MFFRFAPMGKSNKGVLVGGLFQAAQKARLTKVVQLRWKRVFSTFHIGAKRKSTLGIEFDEVGFIPPFWVVFEISAKIWVDEGRPIALKTRFVDFPHRGEAKMHPWDRILRGRFIPPFWVGFSKQRKKPGWRRSSNCVQNAFVRLSPSGRNEKEPLKSNSTRSLSCLHFGFVFPSSGKSRVDECRPIAFKTRFFDFPHRGETKKNPWNGILRGRFHTSSLGWFFQAAQKAGLTKVV